MTYAGKAHIPLFLMQPLSLVRHFDNDKKIWKNSCCDH